MDTFSLGGAWSAGYRFFTQRLALHLLVLLGLGIAIPLALQLALFGQISGVGGPLPAQSRLAHAAGPLEWVIQIAGYILQLGSYFTSWRLGFAPGQRLDGAFLFGILASLLGLAVFAIVGTPALFAIRASFSSGIPFLGLLVGLALLVLVGAVFYTLAAALLATIAAIVLILSMILSTMTGNVGLAATWIGGGSGAVVVMYLVLSVVLLWLTTRLSCTTSIMADWKTYNLIAAIRESWRLTLEDQWAIMRYLLLIAFVLAALLIVIFLIAGMGATALFGGGSFAPIGGVLVIGVIVSIPFALLAVLVPAGIYRDFTRSAMAAEIFA
jgi:hypothetical protein